MRSRNLDDRTFEQLLADARRHVAQSCPAWTDLSAGDPGVVLLELFAHLTEVLIYRLNRLPDKAYVEFLRLMGVRIHPPAAARATLRFSRAASAGGGERRRIEIPRGTRVTTAEAGGAPEAPVFVTAATALIEPAADSVEVLAFNCEQIDGELAGHGSGMAGLTVQARKPPIVAPTGDFQDLDVGVESTLEEIGPVRSRLFGGKTYRMWREVETFAEAADDPFAYVADRMSGTITFAPAVQRYAAETESARPEALAEIPPSGREIRLWYRRGGGAAGNVAAGTLTVMKDPVAGVEVTNPARASGGRDAETLANALIRGPQEFHTLRRAVTAREFERFAISAGGASRARALTQAQVWAHATPGTVEVLLVPEVPEASRPGGQLAAATLLEHQTDEARRRIQQELDQRRPLGTAVAVNWCKYKPVGVRVNVTAFRGEDLRAIERRLRDKLSAYITPLPTALQPRGWPFNQPLQGGRLYDLILSEPGVKDADTLRMRVDEVPDQRVQSLAADSFQPNTWHVISGNELFRSTDDGASWEKSPPFPDAEGEQEMQLVRVHRSRAGWVAVITRVPGETAASRVYVSDDCGGTFRLAASTAFAINDVAWILRDQVPALLLATDVGLYQLLLPAGAGGEPPGTGTLEQLIVSDLPADHGFWSVAVAPDVRGRPALVAIAAVNSRGVWVSYEEARSRTFLPIELAEDVRVLTFQNEGTRTFLWAGITVRGNEPGRGCYRWGGINEPWEQVIEGWQGASCYSLAASGSHVYAATYSAGVLSLDTTRPEKRWTSLGRDSGLPLSDDASRHAPVRAVAVAPDGRIIMAGTDAGVFVRQSEQDRFRSRSDREFAERVGLPEGTLFVSGQHEIIVRGEDEQSR